LKHFYAFKLKIPDSDFRLYLLAGKTPVTISADILTLISGEPLGKYRD
jgi:hypothetical protein